MRVSAPIALNSLTTGAHNSILNKTEANIRITYAKSLPNRLEHNSENYRQKRITTRRVSLPGEALELNSDRCKYNTITLNVAIRLNRIDDVKYLLDLQNPTVADPECINIADCREGGQKGISLINFAIRNHCDKRIIEELHRNGAEISLPDSTSCGWMSLHHAAMADHIEAIDFLIEEGIKPDQQTVPENVNPYDTLNALQIAAINGKEAAFNKLLNSGADLNAHAGESYTPIQAAIFHNNVQILESVCQSHWEKLDLKAIDFPGLVFHIALSKFFEMGVVLLEKIMAERNESGGNILIFDVSQSIEEMLRHFEWRKSLSDPVACEYDQLKEYDQYERKFDLLLRELRSMNLKHGSRSARDHMISDTP